MACLLQNLEARSGRMTHKIEIQARDQLVTLVFHGTLDAGALRQIDTLFDRFRGRGVPIRLLLDTGTEAEIGIVEELRRLDGIVIEAKPPFLARWLGK
jgi:hypothetical protein